MEFPDLARHLLLFVMLTVALYTDLAYARVDNLCAYSGMLAGFLCQGLSGGWGGSLLTCLADPAHVSVLNALLGFLVAFTMFFLVYRLGGIGGGDVKLVAAVGSLSGLHVTLAALVFTTAAGAALSLGTLAWRGRLAEGLKGTWGVFRRLGRPALLVAGEAPPAERLSIRYVPAIAAGTLYAWYRTHVA